MYKWSQQTVSWSRATTLDTVSRRCQYIIFCFSNGNICHGLSRCGFWLKARSFVVWITKALGWEWMDEVVLYHCSDQTAKWLWRAFLWPQKACPSHSFIVFIHSISHLISHLQTPNTDLFHNAQTVLDYIKFQIIEIENTLWRFTSSLSISCSHLLCTDLPCDTKMGWLWRLLHINEGV